MIMKPLVEFCTLNMGQSPDSKTYNDQGDGLPFYQGNADFGEIHPKTRVWCAAPVKIAEAADILISVRAPIGAMNIAAERCCIGRGLAALTPIGEKCGKLFLYYALQSKVDSLIAQGTGSTFKAISKKVLETTLIPAYSIHEQEQITTTISHIDRAIAARRSQIVLLDQLVKSRFIELFGDITETVPLSYYIAALSSGKSLAGEEECSNKVLKTGAATYDCFDPTQVKNLPVDYEPREEHRVNTGDVIISRMNTAELVGAAAYVWAAPECTYLPDRLWRAEIKDTACPIFVWQVLIQSSTKESIRSIASGTSGSMKNISKLGLLGIRVKKVPLELQEQFAAFVEQTDKSKYYSSMSYQYCRMAANTYRQEWMTCRTSHS